jgi:hypothetical protein
MNEVSQHEMVNDWLDGTISDRYMSIILGIENES